MEGPRRSVLPKGLQWAASWDLCLRPLGRRWGRCGPWSGASGPPAALAAPGEDEGLGVSRRCPPEETPVSFHSPHPGARVDASLAARRNSLQGPLMKLIPAWNPTEG